MADLVPANATNTNPQTTTEGSLISRFVAILTPIFALLAGLVANWASQHIGGVKLDQTQIVSFMVAVSTTVLAAGWKWLQGWQQHEQLVAIGNVLPIKTAAAPKDKGWWRGKSKVNQSEIVAGSQQSENVTETKK